MALLELDIDVRKGLVAGLPQGDQPVVDADHQDHDRCQNGQHDNGGGVHVRPLPAPRRAQVRSRIPCAGRAVKRKSGGARVRLTFDADPVPI